MNPDQNQLKRLKYYMKNYSNYLKAYNMQRHGGSCMLTAEDIQWTILITHYLKINGDTIAGKIFYLKYCKGKSNTAIQMELFIERTTYFKYHSDIVKELYLLAVVLKLLHSDTLQSILDAMDGNAIKNYEQSGCLDLMEVEK